MKITSEDASRLSFLAKSIAVGFNYNNEIPKQLSPNAKRIYECMINSNDDKDALILAGAYMDFVKNPKKVEIFTR